METSLISKLNAKNFKMTPERRYLNFITGGEGILASQPINRYQMLPEKTRFNYNGHIKPEYKRGLEANSTIFNR